MSQSPKKVILITGCSSGFGLLIAARLSAAGHIVYASMRNTNKDTALLNEVNKRGGSIRLLELDVTNAQSIKDAINTVATEEGHLDVLVNNAGYGIGGAFEDLTEEEIRDQMETNFFGVQNVTREAIGLMRHRKRSKIINISSIAGQTTMPLFGAYNASKWALEAFSESLRYELKQFDIQVLLVEPGSYPTPIFAENATVAANFDNPQSPYFEMSQHFRKQVNDYVSSLDRDPEDVAKLCEKLINASNPPFRSIPDVGSRWLLFFRWLLPFRLYSWLIYNGMIGGINKKKSDKDS